MADPPINGLINSLRELQELLRAVSETHMIDRPSSAKYAECRSALFASGVRPKLPGFLFQCGSLERFRDFINLYHPSARARIEFIDAAFAGCWAELRAHSAAASPSADRFGARPI